MKKVLAFLCLLAACAATSSANLLINPSFEDDILADGTLTGQYAYPQGWFDGDPLGIRNPKRDVRVWNPAGDGTGADEFPDSGIPGGENVSYHVTGQYGPALAQIVTLDNPLAAGDSFDFSFYYGAPNVDPTGLTPNLNVIYYIYGLVNPTGNPFAAGNYAQIDSKFTWGSGDTFMSAVSQGRFKQLDTTFTIPDGSSAIGMENLMVYLVAYSGVCFDEVVLVPEPATLSLLLAGMGLGIIKRKR